MKRSGQVEPLPLAVGKEAPQDTSPSALTKPPTAPKAHLTDSGLDIYTLHLLKVRKTVDKTIIEHNSIRKLYLKIKKKKPKNSVLVEKVKS